MIYDDFFLIKICFQILYQFHFYFFPILFLSQYFSHVYFI